MKNRLVFHPQPSHKTVSFWCNFADVFTYPTDIESEEQFTGAMFLVPLSIDANHIHTYFRKSMDDIDVEDKDSAAHAIR